MQRKYPGAKPAREEVSSPRKYICILSLSDSAEVASAPVNEARVVAGGCEQCGKGAFGVAPQVAHLSYLRRNAVGAVAAATVLRQ